MKLWTGMRWIAVCSMLLMAQMMQVARAASAEDAVVGMVLDVQGNGELLRQGRSNKLQLLSYVKPGAQLKLDAGGKASVSHYGAKLIYQLVGPVVADVSSAALTVVSGKAPVTKSLAEKVVLAAVNPTLGAAALKMRAVGPEVAMLSPGNRSVLLNVRPRFQWSAQEPGSFQLTVTITELPERVVHRATVDGLTWEMPAGAQLERGKDYRWSLSSTSADGAVHNGSAEFSVATEAEVSAVQALKPAASAAIDEWVLYAAILRDRQMLDEAREVWRTIAVRRPDLAHVNPMAR